MTGAGTGLGRGIAQALAEAGADVAVAEIHGESAQVAANELAETGVRAKAYETDVSKSDQVERAFAACAADLGRLDIVVNNAGISRVGPHTQDVTDEDWADSIAVMPSISHEPSSRRTTDAPPRPSSRRGRISGRLGVRNWRQYRSNRGRMPVLSG